MTFSKEDRTCPDCKGELAYSYGRYGGVGMYRILSPAFHCRGCNKFVELIMLKGELKKNVF